MIAPNKDLVPLESPEMQFALQIAHGVSISWASKEAGISQATGYRWAQRPDIRHAVEQFRAALLEAAAGRMGKLADQAINTLEYLLASSDPRVQLAATRQILAGAFKLGEAAQTAYEIAAIEGLVAELQAKLEAGEYI